MAATPPRPSSPVTISRHVVFPPKSGHNLQISPNLEALLEHDELTRRNSGSPTSLYHTTSQVSPLGFTISLPPPPPRSSRKTPQRDQDGASITPRTREVQKKKSATVHSDFWSDALSVPVTDGHSNSTASSRSVTPNPFINPTPVLPPINTPAAIDIDQLLLTPKADEKSLPNESKPRTLRSTSSTRPRSIASEASIRSSAAFHKVEKILGISRDSLHLFASTTGGLKRHDSDRRNARSEHVDPLADQMTIQDKHIRQLPVAPDQNVPKHVSSFGDGDTATALSSRFGSSYLHAFQQGSYFESPKTSPTRSSICYEPRYPSNDQSSISAYAATSLPRLSLPSISMSYNPPPPPPPLQHVDNNAGHDYLSFIDFLSPTLPNDPNPRSLQGNSNVTSSSRRQLQSLTVSSSDSYTTSHHNLSSASLVSMKFAPPSPTSAAVDLPSPIYPHSDASSSSATLSTMRFAPPSPSASHLAPTHLIPVSPSSPNLPLAPPPSSRPASFGKLTTPAFPEISERGRKQKSEKRSVSASPHPFHQAQSLLPPTTNLLDATERADRIRRNRKLARVFGRNPGTEEYPDVDEPRGLKKLPPTSLAALLGSGKPKSHRHAMSVSLSIKASDMKTDPTTPWQMDGHWSPGGRRYSTPLTPSSFTFFVDGDEDHPSKDDPQGSQDREDSRRKEVTSPTSFIDLSDEEVHDDDVPAITFLDAPRQRGPLRLHQSCSTPSFGESLDPDAQAELDRRRKREQLAKLHRFLGSSVPMEAVTGGLVGPPLPPAAPLPLPEEHTRENRLRRYKSTADTPQPEFDRGKEELDDKEKALNVRRAQKMEKVFGTLPPQMLYHTRTPRASLPQSQPVSPTRHNPYVLSLDLPSASRNLDQPVYKGKKTHRPGPFDSSMNLLPWKDGNIPDTPTSFAETFTNSFADSVSGYEDALQQSPVYLNYQHSLNSLVDIIDRDDRQSLVELHRFLHGDVEESASEEEITVIPRRLSNGSSLKSERRRSLPSRASMTSLSSEVITTPNESQFQLRRRRAAKLTNFFGVDYRVLIHDVLESIEKGVEEDRKRGSLQPQEVEVLLHRVRSLRTLENQFS